MSQDRATALQHVLQSETSQKKMQNIQEKIVKGHKVPQKINTNGHEQRKSVSVGIKTEIHKSAFVAGKTLLGRQEHWEGQIPGALGTDP